MTVGDAHIDGMDQADEDLARRDLYAPLDVNQFRLFRITRKTIDARIELALEIHNLNEVPEYIALSYCWGDDPPNIPCICNDNLSITITETLHAALIQCVLNYAGYWWVDQVCIDQHSNIDKAQQIPNMGRIYSKASKVITWLGTADYEMPPVYRLIKNFVDQTEVLFGRDLDWGNFGFFYFHVLPRVASYLVLGSVDDPAWDALDHLMKRPWFQRTWTIQEFWLANELYLVCGDYSIEWDQIIAFLFATMKVLAGKQTRISGECATGISFWFDLRTCRGADAKNLNPNLIVEEIMSKKASVPHDKVYGLLTMFKHLGLGDLSIDYDAPFQSIFASFTKRVISLHEDLSILQLKRAQPEIESTDPPELPSWIPDLRHPHVRDRHDHRAFEALDVHGEARLFLATGLSKCKIDLDDSLSLSLKGVKVSTLQMASQPSGTLRGQWNGPNVLKFGDWWETIQSSGDDVYPATGETLDVAFARARIWDTFPRSSPDRYQGRRVLHRSPMADDIRRDILYQEELESSAEEFQAEEVQIEKLDPELGAAIIRGTFDQRLFIDDADHIVIGHESCLVGDEVWLVMGSALSYILRPLTTGGYEFKGEAYVHGIMDGEYLVDKFKRTDVKSDGLTDKQWLSNLKDCIPFETKEIVLT